VRGGWVVGWLVGWVDGLLTGVLVGVAVTTITMGVGGGRVGVTTITMAVGRICGAALHALIRIRIALIKNFFFITACSTYRSPR
jgi:hypothetical protein